MDQDPLGYQLAMRTHGVWRALAPRSLRRKALPLVRRVMETRVAWALRAGEPPPAPGPLIVSGLLSEAKGVSEGARLSLAAFEQAGLAPLSHDLRPLFSDGRSNGRIPTDVPGGVWFVHVNAPESIQALGRLDPATWKGRHRIAYWAYELSCVPDYWARIASAFHEIWAPSQFVVDAVVNAGVKTPVRLMPHPVSLGDPPGTRSRAAFAFLEENSFVVLALGDLKSSATRKNLAGAIRIYCRAFPASGRAKLVVKLRESEAYPDVVVGLQRLAADRSDVHFMTADLHARELRQLIASSDLILSPHRSEGFGLSLAEAFMAGVPALATGWSGNLAFMAAPELLIGHRLVDADDPQRIYRSRGQQWAEPDVEEAATKLQRLASDPQLRGKLAARGRADVEALALRWRRENLLALPIGRLTTADDC